jgi:hypothetical protein
MPLMHGDHLTWWLFWLGVLFSVIVNLGTGMLLAVTFFTLQLRRDLQERLDEISMVAHQMFDAITMSRIAGDLKSDAGATEYVKLIHAWQVARRTLHFALSKSQWEKLVTGIDALRRLRDMYVGPATEEYWKRYEIHTTNDKGVQVTLPTDFEGWAIHYKLTEELEKYREFAVRREEAEREIDYLLFYDPDKIESEGDPNRAQSLPTELEQAWDFPYLFPLAWKWFLSEVFTRPIESYRDGKGK